MTNNHKTDPKPFWKYVKSKTSYPRKISYSRTDAGEFETDKEKAQSLNESFSKVFTNEDTTGSHLHNLKTAVINVPIDKINISKEKTIVNRIQRLDLHKAWGPDDLHPKLIEKCSSEISCFLKMTFNESLNDGEISQNWKKANVTAVFKKRSQALSSQLQTHQLNFHYL